MDLVMGESSLKKCPLLGFKEQIPPEFISFKTSLFLNFFLFKLNQWFLSFAIHSAASMLVKRWRYSLDAWTELRSLRAHNTSVSWWVPIPYKTKFFLSISNIPQEHALLGKSEYYLQPSHGTKNSFWHKTQSENREKSSLLLPSTLTSWHCFIFFLLKQRY